MTDTFITLPYKLERAAPKFEANAIKFPESLARYFIKKYTKRGDAVFDPFAGLGTTLFVAEELGRVPYGMEYDPQRHEWVAGQLKHWMQLRQGDSAMMNRHGFPAMDFCLTSPPFMPHTDKWNPLFAGDPAKAGYAAYLKRLGQIFAQLARLMKKGGVVVVQVDNIPGKNGKPMTPLVHDMARVIGKSLTLQEEVIVAWDGGPKTYRHTHCLVFKAA